MTIFERNSSLEEHRGLRWKNKQTKTVGSWKDIDYFPCQEPTSSHQAPIVQTLDSAIHRINHYPADSVIDFRNTYPLDSDISGG